MKDLNNPLYKYLDSELVLASERFTFHRAHSRITYEDYRENQRRAIRDSISAKCVVYLDTNAWKCLSDFERKKSTLTESMIDFAQTMNSGAIRDKFVFPIGAATLFELQSMDDPVSLSTLIELVDRFSMGVGCPPPDEAIRQELALFHAKTDRESGVEPERFCHPSEIFGIVELYVPDLLPVPETLAFKKTMLDIVHSLPISAHLEMAVASDLPQWDNNEGIATMNEGMLAHQHQIKSYADALLVELSGILHRFVPDGPPIRNFPPAKAHALRAMIHWHDNPQRRQLITARILANLHASVRHLANRKFRKGDIADFTTAQIALPCAHAFFTDKALANLLKEPNIALKQFCSCEVVSGFGNFSAYLKDESPLVV